MEDIDIPFNLEVHPLGDNGEIDVLPASGKNLLSSSQLPCGLPPILPDTKAILNSFLQDLDKLPILQLDAVQRLIPIEPDISSLHSINLCPLQTMLCVKRNMMTGKLLGFSEEVKDIFEGTHKTSTSLSRTPGPPEAGVKGSSSSFPFWPGGMDEPVTNILKQESLNTALFDEEFLDTPPGFKSGMKFERKNYDQVDFIHFQPQKIYLSDVLAMDDMPELDLLNETEENAGCADLQKPETQESKEIESEDPILKIASSSVLKISKSEPAKPTVHYDWAVVENAKEDVTDFHEKIPKMAHNFKFELDIFQKRAILHLEKKESVFVAAHTSAGKTVVAEYAIALAKKNVTRVIYTSPIKALSNQKFRDFKTTFGDVGLITGDVQKNPTGFCLIMTTEILRSMLYHGSDVIRELEWVIFDEVHYINDSERGVVWEEVFIMLPDHVNLIMLSATVPNTAEFAEWLGGIKKRKIYVINTLERPVPLVYHLYTGSVGKTEDSIFPILDSRSGKFLENKYNDACSSKKEKDAKSKGSSGPKGPKFNVSQAQEKNIYIGLLNHLKRKDLMPAICFTFSRKRCNMHAIMLASQDLTTKEEKGKIHKFFSSCISNLKEEDQKLPQVLMMGELLQRGFGIHHSGILPILKEVVEMLVKDRLVKILFTTETFAMGVNMPAKTVVFDSIRKHDGNCFRDLQPSEFIQMAGRAGRRGLDDTGTVILLCKGDVPDVYSLKNMMLGKPTKLESQFKLTYSMILNLLKIKEIRVEDVMKSSFGESENQKKQKKTKSKLEEAVNAQRNMTKPDCSLCNIDLHGYIKSLKKLRSEKPKVMIEKCSLAFSKKLLVPGRILAVSLGDQRNVPCVILCVDKENKCKVLLVAEKKDTLISSNSGESITLPWSRHLFYPHNRKPEVKIVMFEDVEVISNKAIRIQESEILKEWRRMETMRSDPGDSITAAFQDLCSFSEANLNGFSSANISFKGMNVVDKACEVDNIENSFENFMCIKCPEFSKHFAAFSLYEELTEDIERYKYQLSEESLAKHPEYKMRKNVLKSLKYIDAGEETVELKGSVAREMSNHELLITELLVKSVFSNCEPADIAALLSCMVFQQKSEDLPQDLPNHLKKKVQEIIDVAIEISNEQFRWGIEEHNFVEQYNFHLANVVYEWAKGTHFASIMLTTDVDEGIIVRSIQRLSELLKDVHDGAKLVGDTVLAKKMDDASHLIKRDIVFAASLYTQ